MGGAIEQKELIFTILLNGPMMLSSTVPVALSVSRRYSTLLLICLFQGEEMLVERSQILVVCGSAAKNRDGEWIGTQKIGLMWRSRDRDRAELSSQQS